EPVQAGTADPVRAATAAPGTAEPAALPGEPALLPVLMGGAAARESAVLLSLPATPPSPACDPVLTWTWPPGTLCRSALSTRFATRLSARLVSPVTAA